MSINGFANLTNPTGCGIMRAMARQINYASEAIDALGGHRAVAKLFDIDDRVVSNWRVRGFPPSSYAALAPLLVERGCNFSPGLFGQRMLAALPKQVRRRRPRKGNGGEP
jgi:hypothetical protein